MSDSTTDTALQDGQNAVAGEHSIRTEDFAHAPVIYGERHHPRKTLATLLALCLVFLGVICLFAVLRILFQPYILGGPGLVLVVVPLTIIAGIALLFFGSRMLMRGAHHSRRW